MPRGKGKSSSGKKSTRGSAGGTKSKEIGVVDFDCEGSEGEEGHNLSEDEEKGQSDAVVENLPVAPSSSQALRKVIIAPKG